MAGWKLRKDKTQSEAEPPAADMDAQGAQVYTAPGAGAEQSERTGRAPDLEGDDALRFEDEDGPLKMIDYSAPFSDDLLPMSFAPIIAAPPPADTHLADTHLADTHLADAHLADTHLADAPPVERPPVEMPTLATPSFDTSGAEPSDESGDFTSTLRMSREELAAAFAPAAPAGIPIVAPFVLDAPLVSPATEETPPRLVVRMGRLSAAFDVTKEVTVIGRPDSEMHYYPDVEIDLDDAVSRRHAEIIRRDNAYSIVDTGSTNGTLLNGETLLAHEERPLTHGDRIRVGERTEIVFE